MWLDQALGAWTILFWWKHASLAMKNMWGRLHSLILKKTSCFKKTNIGQRQFEEKHYSFTFTYGFVLLSTSWFLPVSRQFYPWRCIPQYSVGLWPAALPFSFMAKAFKNNAHLFIGQSPQSTNSYSNWWFGCLGSPYERDCYLGVALESQTTNPNHQLTISWSNRK